jgi:Mn2+/Fe2+ NRAMP family transporter
MYSPTKICAADSWWTALLKESDDYRIVEVAMSILTILIIILVLFFVGAFPAWPHSRNWGYYPSGGVGIILVIIVVLLLPGHV